MAIRIITDSASDITQEEARAWGIQVMPLRTLFGQEEFLDGVTIDHQQFYQRLVESDVLPTTSQLTPFQYEEVFRAAADAGTRWCASPSPPSSPAASRARPWPPRACPWCWWTA